MILAILGVKAQTEISIGTGTAGNTSTGYPCPLQDYFEGSRAQYLFTAAELTAAGMAPGNITGIKFNVTALNGAGLIEKLSISIGSTSVGSLSATTWEPGTTGVYGPIDYQPVLGDNTFTFSTPFIWNGSDNIIIEICNGEPTNATGTWFTNNPTIPWTTGLSFNGSHTYRADNIGNGCGTATTTNTGTQTTRPNITFSWVPATSCSGTPAGGNAQSTITNLCSSNIPFNLSVTGATAASGLTYQWQSSPNGTAWSDIPGATGSSYTVSPGISTTTYYRRRIACGVNSSFSQHVVVNVTAPVYTTLPFTESFETSWIDGCGTSDIPANYWRNTPPTGNNSWRRNDDAANANTAAWVNPNLGVYTPDASAGSFSARFHSYQSSSGTKGQLDLYVNCNTGVPGKRLSFDFINTSGNDSLVVLVSTNGGASFTRLDSVRTSTVWKNKAIVFSSTSATTIIRFEATSDFGVTDIGLDNINLVNLPNCTGTPVGGTLSSTASTVCPGVPFTLSVNGATDPATAFGITFQWQSSPDGTNWTNIAGATGATFSSAGISTTTQYRRQTICSGNIGVSNAVTIIVSAPVYAPMPFTESFEASWLSVCDVNDAPNNFWRGSPVTGNNSWRRSDDAATPNSANWTSPALGIYAPTASVGLYSARFHTYFASSGTKGQLNLYLNAATATPSKRLTFDVINTSGTDTLSILISTNGGTTFTRLDSAGLASAWRTKTIVFNSTSATTIIRFEATSDFGVTDIGLDNINIIDFPNCSGTPTGGTTTSTASVVCPSTPFTLNVTGATEANGITYQWQSSPDGTTWTNIAGATSANYTSNGITTATFYRRQIFCGANSAASSTLSVTLSAPTYAALPFAESFENTWINGCGLRDIPNNSWRNVPVTGNTSWRRDDDGASAGWTSNNGDYNPDGSDGIHSARFHSYDVSGRGTGQFNLYINAATASASKRLSYDFINTSGTDSLTILLSTDGGATFTRLDSAQLSATWRTKTVQFTSSSATTVIRFLATGDFGVTDIGLDNILITDFAPCSGAPNAGTTVSSANAVCSEQFTLRLQGSTSGSGITYQWQRSTDGTTWSDITGATGFTYTTAQTGTTWYRALVACGSEISSSIPVQVISPSLVRGTFRINNELPTNVAARTFNNFNDAYNHIKCGIDSAVVFLVQDNANRPVGVYNEQLIMAPVPGASITNTVTFKGQGSTIAFSSNNTNERAVIKLRGADYIRFDSLIINASAGSFGYGVQLVSNADSNIVSNCIINLNSTATTQNYAGVVINGTETGPISTGSTLCDFNQFINNKINGGFAGFTLVATPAGANLNNRFVGNDVKDFYQYGIFVQNSSGTLIDSNSFSRPTRATVTEFIGVHFTGISTASTISRNRITNPFGGALASTSAFTGINFSGVDATAGSENFVVNNLIGKLNGMGAQTGISNTSSDNVWYLHNTIAIDSTTSTSTSTARGFFQTTTAGGILLFNNMITISRGGAGAKHAIYMATNTTGFLADYNNYFLNAPAGTNFVGFFNANQATINNWRAVTNQDANSLSRNPFYANAGLGDFRPTNGAVDNKGFYAGIDRDIVGVQRLQATPDIGAFEFVALPCTLPPDPGNTIFNDTTVCQNSPVRLNLTVSSWGATQTFQWQTSTSPGGPWTNMGGVMVDPDTTIIASTTLYFRAAVTCGGSTVFSNPVELLVSPALPAGIYTIQPPTTTYVPGVSGGNFLSFNAAKAAMACGIVGNGQVVFNVVPNSGPYLEQLRLDSIPGTSATNTITFNGNGNTISSAGMTTNERAVIKLNGADHIIFDSLIINAAGGTTHGWGVQLQNNADSNVFRRNTILSSTSSTSTNYAGVVISGSETSATATGNTASDGNLFDRNTIQGGYYGITLMGGTTVQTRIDNNRFTNNQIRDFYETGFYVGGTTNTLLEGNMFSRPTRTNTASSVYGVYATSQPSTNFRISKNRFTRFFAGIANNTATFYGVYHNSVDATAGGEVRVSNNLIYGLEGNAPMYGFYNVGSDNVFYYHNTISFDNSASTPSGATAGLYHTTAASGIFFRNNIVTIRRGGTGSKHAVYMNVTPTTGTYVEANNNNYLVTGTNAHIGYRTTNRTTLAQWQAASAQDVASFNLNPLYADTANGNYRPQITALNDKGTPVGITSDIENATRSNTLPDIGAYEFAPVSCQNPPVAGTASVTPNSGICLETPIRLTTTGHSPLGNITFQWQYSPDGTANWTNISGVQYFPEFDTITTVNTYYRAAVVCDGVTTYTNVVQVNLNPLLLQGVYTINPTGSGSNNFTNFQSAVNAMLCGITGPVVFNVAAGTYNEQIHIPYIPNTSVTNTVTFQSANGNPASVTLSTAGTAANNFTLRLDSTRHFTFRNMGFAATDATNGRAVVLQNNASHINFINNIINTPTVTTASANVVGIYANAFIGRNIVLRRNVINNGSRGIHFAGTSATNLAAAGHIIDSNTVNNPFNYGIYTEFTQRLRVTDNRISVTGAMAANSAGIYANYADTAFRLIRNTVEMNGNNSAALAYGIYLNNSRSLNNDSSIVASNRFHSDSNNTGNIYGLTIAASKAVNIVNNVVALNNGGSASYGLYSLNNTDNINYYNNSVNVANNSTTNYAGYFNHSATSGTTVHNNIFAANGGGRALYVNNPANFTADYNMLYTTGANLVQVNTGTVLNFANLKAWTNTWNWDRWSIAFKPAFMSNSDLRPALDNPDVWAMHGRGTQVPGNSYDFNNNPRSQTLTGGVPDLGAYEFFPTAQPTILTATPAAPAPNTTQTFSYGTDTVMKIAWGPTAPPTVIVRRFSGVVPTGLTQPRPDSMFFYTKVDVGGTNNYQYSAKLYYINPWQGSIPQQYQIGMGRTTPSNAWVVGQNSKVDIAKKEISQDAIVYLDRFTGLINPDAKPENEDSTSNRGRDFWVGYQRTNGFGTTPTSAGSQNMVIYMGAGDQPANVTITIEGTSGTPWVRTYAVPANSTRTSEIIPKLGADDARLFGEGLYNKKGIHITSDVPITAYAHIYESTNSGATMLMPSTVWGYEYYTLQSRQNYSSVSAAWPSASAFHIVAQSDSTIVEINPSAPTLGGWVPNGGPFNGNYRIRLNKGDAYQVLGASLNGAEGHDLTGSYVKSIAGSQGCFPIAVFAGSTRTGLGCGTSAGGSGDLIIQQIFPYQAWGTKYATAPTSNQNGPNATSHMTNIYRVMVKDPTTQVKRNGTVIPTAQLINSRYYQFESNTGDYIESNKPVMVAQYMSSSGSCTNTSGDGDPEMFYLSPIEQAVKKTQFYRNNLTAIDQNYITLIIPTEGLQTLRIDGVNYLAYPVAERFAYNHPNLNGYSIVTKRWAAGSGSSSVESDFPFTGVVYGIGSVESYGYNLGTLVKNLNNLSSVNTQFNVGANPTGYTCKDAPFQITVLLPLIPDSIRFNINAVQGITPSTNVTLRNPTPTATVSVNGVSYYSFTLNTNYVSNTAGTFNIPIDYWSPEIESCDKKKSGSVSVQVLPKPITNFTIAYPAPNTTAACQGDAVSLTGDLITSNGIALNQWQWTFAPGGSLTTAAGQNQTISYANAGTYAVTLRGVTADGCISDTTKNVVINAKPVVTVQQATQGVCPGQSVTFNISNPIAGAVYTWYNAATGGTALGTGTSYTLTNAAPPQSLWVSATANGCTSATRLEVTTTLLGPLTPANVRVLSRDVNSVTFAWDAVNLANPAAYMVSVGGGAFIPANGLPNLTHTVTGLRPTDTVSIRVMAVGNASCQTSTSAAVTGQTLPDQIFIPNSFSPNGDGLNDRLMVYGYVIRDMQFTIFNQWGEKIFESRDQNTGWDGTHKGKGQPSGVYIYVAKFTLRDGSTIERKGTINLVR